MSDLPQTPAEVRAWVVEITARADIATPGPWEFVSGPLHIPDGAEVHGPVYRIAYTPIDDIPEDISDDLAAATARRNARFIASARTDIAALCAMVLKQQEALERVEAVMRKWERESIFIEVMAASEVREALKGE